MSTQQMIVDNDFFGMHQIDNAVNRWLDSTGTEDAFLIYVHGKGRKEPEKTQELLPDLVDFYNVRPLVLHWKPCGGLWPDDGAKPAGAALVTLLRNLVVQRPVPKPIVLLGQSMGNLAIQVVGESVRDGNLDLPANLLTAIVLSAAAVEPRNHREWLEVLAQRGDTYVVVNEHDNMLDAAKVFLRKDTLGRGLAGMTLARDVTYVDLSRIGKDFHRYYRPDNRKVPRNVKAFYDKVLRGLKPDLDAFPLVRGQIRELS